MSDWKIQKPHQRCAVTNEEFATGDIVWSTLFEQDGKLYRVDLGDPAWQARYAELPPSESESDDDGEGDSDDDGKEAEAATDAKDESAPSSGAKEPIVIHVEQAEKDQDPIEVKLTGEPLYFWKQVKLAPNVLPVTIHR